jgi:single-stranded-DNA-specific exonuclease
VWVLSEVEEAAVSALVGTLGVLPATARCLARRGLDRVSAGRFLTPRLASIRPPEGLIDLDKAVARLVRAVRAREPMGVFGDYDVDGVTTCALLTGFLRAVGAAVKPRVASRAAGYGFGLADVAFFAERGVSLIVTGDCGTSDVQAIAHARALGIDVIVVDHHTVPDNPERHPAVALINPLRPDSTFGFRGLASVGLAFYVAAALRTALRGQRHFTSELPEPDVRDWLDLVAIGTIADLVPLVEENRVLASVGLRRVARRTRRGLRALLDQAGVDAGRGVDERTVGWKISPRLNAPGRLGDAAPALGLLLADDSHDAASFAAQLEQANDRRRQAQGQVLQEATAMVEAGELGAAIVVAGVGWPCGLVGIVAAKLAERYRRTTFVIAVDPDTGEGRGSARAVRGVNLYDALHECRDHLIRYGGHAAAAGLTVRRDQLDPLRVGLELAVARQLAGNADSEAPAYSVDAVVSLADVDDRLAVELASMAPFGKGNEQPLLGCRGLTVVESRVVGCDGGHLKLRLSDDAGRSIDGIAFGQAAADPGSGAVIDVVFTPEVSKWQGCRRVEMIVRAFAAAAAPMTAALDPKAAAEHDWATEPDPDSLDPEDPGDGNVSGWRRS